MSEKTEVTYLDGDVVWVKLGSSWWPGEVWGFEKLPPGILKSFRKQPIAVVKFFQEDTFEYVKNLNLIYKYNCSRKNEFIKKGLDLFRSKQTHMDKFPEDVCTAERRTDGNPDIITDDEFLPKKKESYANIFGSPPSESTSQLKKTPGKRGRPPASQKWNKNASFGASTSNTPQRQMKPSNYKARILVQPNNIHESEVEVSDDDSNVSVSLGSEKSETTPKKLPTPVKLQHSSPAQQLHTCPTCNFTSTRLNVIILHNKSHSVTSATYYTPMKKPKARSPLLKEKSKSENLPSVRVDENNDFPSRRKRSAKSERIPAVPAKVLHDDSPSGGRTSNSKLKSKEKTISPPKRKLKSKEKEAKKPKTDVEIKNSLLADWNEDSDDESMDILSSLKLTENQNASTPPIIKNDQLDASNVSDEKSPVKSDRSSLEKSEISTPIKSVKPEETPKVEKREQASCFDFEEDEDLQIERLDRKIPRLSIKSDDSKKVLESMISDAGNDTVLKNSSSADTVSCESEALDLDSEINNLLKETVVPELPSLPSNTNFQKSKVVKVPDKEKDAESNYVFKTKTFFRSRHSRSQDAIEKYVADNTSTDKPPTYMEETVDSEKSNDVNSESSTKNEYDTSFESLAVPALVDSVKVTKFAPKIQLKKMKAALNTNKLTQDSNLKPQPESSVSFDSYCDNLPLKSSTIEAKKDILKDKNDKSTTESKTIENEKSKNSLEILVAESNIRIEEPLTTNLPSSTVPATGIQSKEVETASLVNKKEIKIDKNITSAVDKLREDEPSKKPEIQLKNSELDKSTKLSSVPSLDISTESPKLFQILDESKKPVSKSHSKTSSPKLVKPQGKEKILNFDVGSSSPRTTESQKIIIRRKTNTNASNFESNEFSDSSQEVIFSSKTKWGEDGVQTFTIEGTSGANVDLPEPKYKKVATLSPKHTSQANENRSNIDDNLEKTSETSDSFTIKQTVNNSLNTIEVVKSQSVTEPTTKVSDRLSPIKSVDSCLTKRTIESSPSKRPKIIVKSVIEKSVSPNILSRSVKAKTMKHLLLVDQSKSENHMLISQPENSSKSLEDIMKQNISPQAQKEKIIINTGKIASGKKTQKIVVNTSPKPTVNIETPTGTSNAYMILTNSQGVQSKIVLTPEHQKLLFPKIKPTNSTVTSSTSKNKSESNTEPQHHTQSFNIVPKQKGTILNSKGQIVMSGNSSKRTILTTMPGQAILTSKGQIIAPQSSIITSSAKLTPNVNKSTTTITSNSQSVHSTKVVQSQRAPSKGDVHSKPERSSSASSKASGKIVGHNQTMTLVQGQIKDPALLLAQKSGTIMRLTAAQFEHMQKTGQLIQKSPVPKNSNSQNKVPSGKMQNQRYILQKFAGGKQSADLFETKLDTKRSDAEFVSGKSKSETTKLSTSVTTHTEKVPVVPTKPKFVSVSSEIEKLFDLADSKASDSDDSNMFENLDKLIPATIIPTRKRDASTRSVAQKDKKPPPTVQPEVQVSKVVTAEPKETEILSTVVEDNQSLSANSLGGDSQKQLLAIPGENFGGPPNSFFLCMEENGTLTPVDNQPLVLENNQLVPMTMSSLPALETDDSLLASTSELPNILKESQAMDSSQVLELPVDQTQRSILINTGEQQLLVDHQTFLSLLAGDGQQLVTADGQNLVLQGGTQQILSALAGSPELANLLASGQQILLNATGDAQQDAHAGEQKIIITTGSDGLTFSSEVQPNVNQDILAAALASTEVFQQDSLIHESMNISAATESIITMEINSLSPKIPNVANAPVHSNVFETSTTLNQPIMSPLEHPTTKRTDNIKPSAGLLAMTNNSKIIPKNLEDSLAVIGVAPTNVPTSLELPITVTNPRIAAKTTSPLGLSCSTVYQSGLINSAIVSPGMSLFESDLPPSTIMGLTDVTTLDYLSPSEPKIDDKPQSEQNEKELEKSFDNKVSINVNNDEHSSKKSSADEERVVENDTDQSLQLSAASSMPCLDESTSESYSEDASSQISDNIENNAFPPISMPILTDDSSEQLKIDANASLTEHNDATEQSKDADDDTSEFVESEQLISETIPEEAPEEVLVNNVSIEKDVNVTNAETFKSDDPQETDGECKQTQETIGECMQTLNASDMEILDTNNIVDEPMSPHIDAESEEICAETPPDFTQNNSPMHYDDQDMEDESMMPNEAEENSIPDHLHEELAVSLTSGMVTLPDSTLSGVETVPEPLASGILYSDSSSDDSNEIPIQPTISVSHHMVQNFSSLLNSATAEDKSNDCSDRETKMCENYDNNHEEASAVECEMEGER